MAPGSSSPVRPGTRANRSTTMPQGLARPRCRKPTGHRDGSQLRVSSAEVPPSAADREIHTPFEPDWHSTFSLLGSGSRIRHAGSASRMSRAAAGASVAVNAKTAEPPESQA